MSAQQESMPVNALFRLLEAVAKSIKHATDLWTIMAIELLRAQGHAAIASSKILLDHSSHALRNDPNDLNSSFTIKLRMWWN